MKWIEPVYSKEKVKKAGQFIVKAPIESNEFKLAIPIFHNWRAAHAFPTQILLDLLRKNAIRVDSKTIVVQRLKRVRSIAAKLFREKNMSLSRMEDIGGCRAVVGNINQVYDLYNKLKKSRTKHELFRERDYIATPKTSGYRGIHLIYKYNGGKAKFKGLPVELQLRSRIQHSWATAVEVVGTFTKQALKASAGEYHWLEFFKCASAEFAILEGREVEKCCGNTDTLTMLKKYVEQLDVDAKLNAFNVVTRHLTTDRRKQEGYFILQLDLTDNRISIMKYDKTQLEAATSNYDKLEQETAEDSSKDIVLVSAQSLRDLKRAYPNYFSDTAEFQANLKKVLGAKITRK